MNPAAPSTHTPPDYVGPYQIAERLGVQVQTVYKWRWRNLLPEQDLPGLWLWNTIYVWARQTGRL